MNINPEASMWNTRYSKNEYVYGKKPNSWLEQNLLKLSPGDILFPGEGEGRNAVYAAVKGWVVHCFDCSSEGRKKALALASEHGVQISYELAAYNDFYSESKFDVIALIYTHSAPEIRKNFHRNIQSFLKIGGSIVLEAFHKNQAGNQSGGPKDPEMLYDESMLRNDFSGLDIIHLGKQEIMLDEGELHSGKASVIRMIAVRKS